MDTLIAPCGIDCRDCKAYIATVNNDQQQLKEVAEFYFTQHGKEVKIEELYCDGCGADGRHIGFCAKCDIRACAFGKGFHTCAECSEFPCEKGSFIWRENSASKARLDKLIADK